MAKTMHEQLKNAVSEALDSLYGDTSVPRSTTKNSLEELREDIDLLLETLDDDV